VLPKKKNKKYGNPNFFSGEKNPDDEQQLCSPDPNPNSKEFFLCAIQGELA
jgi:hypothetical protein